MLEWLSLFYFRYTSFALYYELRGRCLLSRRVQLTFDLPVRVFASNVGKGKTHRHQERDHRPNHGHPPFLIDVAAADAGNRK